MFKAFFKLLMYRFKNDENSEITKVFYPENVSLFKVAIGVKYVQS